jgi:hypothetical protein
MKVGFALLLALTGCAASMDPRDVPNTVDRPRVDSGIREDSPLIIPFFDVPAVDVVERDVAEIDSPAVDVPNRDVPNQDTPNAVDAPTVNDVPLMCPPEAQNCGRQCCLGFASCADNRCFVCMPGANTRCERPDGVVVCVNDQSNSSHCGRCNNACLANAPFCVAGRCAPR